MDVMLDWNLGNMIYHGLITLQLCGSPIAEIEVVSVGIRAILDHRTKPLEIDKDIGKQPTRRRKTNVQQKSDCTCVMMVKEEGGVWKIKTLDLEHNHELCPRDRDHYFLVTSI